MASPLTIQPSSKDTLLHGYNKDTNFGAGGAIEVGSGKTPTYYWAERSLVEFAIIWGTDIPVGATLTAATLWLYTYNSTPAGGEGRTYWAYRLLRLAWEEYQATWNSYKTGSNWTTAGCGSDGNDYTSVDGASAVVPASQNWINWDVLAQVQTAQAGNLQIAFLVKDAAEGNYTSYSSIWSREYFSGITFGPALVIEYTGGDRSYTVRQNDERGKPIFLAECKAYNMTTGALIDTKYTDNGIAVFDNLPFDARVNIEVRWDKQYRLYENVYEASGGQVLTLVNQSHVQNTDDYVEGTRTSEPFTPAVGEVYVG